MVLIRPLLIDFAGNHPFQGSLVTDSAQVNVAHTASDHQQAADAVNDIGGLHRLPGPVQVGEKQEYAGADHGGAADEQDPVPELFTTVHKAGGLMLAAEISATGLDPAHVSGIRDVLTNPL